MFRKNQNQVFFLRYCDLPNDALTPGFVSVDSEFLGLNPIRDRLCLVQIFDPRTRKVYIIQLPRKINNSDYPNLINVMVSRDYCKIFHYSPADIHFIAKTFKIKIRNTLCTRTLSKITRTASNSHSLHTLVKTYIGRNLNKNYSNDYWGSAILSKNQIEYACNDVIYLHIILLYLLRIAAWEGRLEVYRRANRIIEFSIDNAIAGFPTEEILPHS